MRSVVYHFVANFLLFQKTSKNTEAIIIDFACTRRYSLCKWRLRHVRHARHWHLKS